MTSEIPVFQITIDSPQVAVYLANGKIDRGCGGRLGRQVKRRCVGTGIIDMAN